MLDLQLAGLQELSLRGGQSRNGYDASMVSLAYRRFTGVHGRGRTQRALRRLLGREKRLVCLEQVMRNRSARSTYEAGIRSVAIKDIVGSEGRACDFDGDWRPIKESSRGRWMGIAMARESRTPLPPISLIEVDGKYYVRDGHHRISVARSLGNEFIEADVQVWQVTPASGTQAVKEATEPAFAENMAAFTA